MTAEKNRANTLRNTKPDARSSSARLWRLTKLKSLLHKLMRMSEASALVGA